MVIISEIDAWGRVMYECNGPCGKIYNSDHLDIAERTHEGDTYCPKCWKKLDLKADEEDEEKNQLWWFTQGD